MWEFAAVSQCVNHPLNTTQFHLQVMLSLEPVRSCLKVLDGEVDAVQNTIENFVTLSHGHLLGSG
jgi:hypothetical protein